MKKYILIVCTILFTMNLFAGCALQKNQDGTGGFPDDSFSEEDYRKLLALQDGDYRHMTISEYRSHIAKLTDTEEYKSLLERFWKSRILYGVKDTDRTAAFLFYVLPLAGEDWEARNYAGETLSHYPAGDARLEYSFTMTVLRPDRLMIKDYDDTRLGVTEMMQDILRNRTEEELRDEEAMEAEVRTFVDGMLSYMRTEDVDITMELAYFSLAAGEDNRQSLAGSENGRGEDEGQGLKWGGDGREEEGRQGLAGNADGREAERRRYANATEEDYRSLLALKTADYEDMSIAEFNAGLLRWANDDFGRMERIDADMQWDDTQVSLSEEERMFVRLTAFLSGTENGELVQSSYTKEAEADPVYSQSLPQKLERDGRQPIWCDLSYQFSYRIADRETLTVGERDRAVGGMVSAIQAFWDEATLEELHAMTEDDIVSRLASLAAEYSSDGITITIHGERIHFEHTDRYDLQM